MSESSEMYLLRIALLQREEQPVPLPRLAEQLGVTHVSANQMCRKLHGSGLLRYSPYKGVTLTRKGQATANGLLRRRRLWEVFLVDKLGLSLEKAEEVACRLEHATDELVVERLAEYLGHPQLCPHNEPIPSGDSARPVAVGRALTTLNAGDRGQIVGFDPQAARRDFLQASGIAPGVEVRVLAVAEDGTLLVETPGGQITISRRLASKIDVARGEAA